jgi:hypothetical protein
MKAQEFVDAVRTLVMDAAVEDTVSLLEKPPGKKPQQELVELSRWWHGLPDADRVFAKRMLAFAARQAVFGLFSVLDGARSVTRSNAATDYFELRHIHGTSVDILGGPSGEPLHELL